MIKTIKRGLKKYKKTDFAVKTRMWGQISLVLTLVFLGYNFYIYLSTFNHWNGWISTYYVMLMMLRAVILISDRDVDRNDLKRRKEVFTISHSMLFMTIFILVMPVLLMITGERQVKVGAISAIGLTVFTVIKVTFAILNLRFSRQHNEGPFITELRCINMIDAIVSILTIQNTLVMVFAHVISDLLYSIIALTSVAGIGAVTFITILSYSYGIDKFDD